MRAVVRCYVAVLLVDGTFVIPGSTARFNLTVRQPHAACINTLSVVFALCGERESHSRWSWLVAWSHVKLAGTYRVLHAEHAAVYFIAYQRPVVQCRYLKEGIRKLPSIRQGVFFVEFADVLKYEEILKVN